MKKIYLLGFLAAALGVNAQSQKKAPTPEAQQAQQTQQVNRDITPVSPVVNKQTGLEVGASGKGIGKNSRWVVVGQTEFDRPTNASNYRRIIVYPDGKKSVIWTTSVDGASSGYQQRGTGYNHFDGASWGEISKARIEAVRAGYPNLDFDPVNNTEMVISHKAAADGTSGGLLLNTNGSIGSTTWNSENILSTLPATTPGVLWPRSVVSGNKLIIIGSYTDSSNVLQPNRMVKAGVRTPQVYSRYDLSTKTWEVENELLPEYDSTRYYSGGGDNYAIDANGNNVAILMGGLTDDVALWKSADNGVTWTKTIIDSFPVPAYNYKTPIVNEFGVLDTPYSSDGSFAVRVDNDGLAHCFWGLVRVSDADTTDQSMSFYPGVANAIAYWYEGRPDSIVTPGFGPEDPNDEDEDYTIAANDQAGRDRVRYANLAWTTAPYTVSSGDTIYLLYQARTDNDLDEQGFAFTDIYVVTSTDKGATWSAPLNLTGIIDQNEEQIFVSAASDCSTMLYLTFSASKSQGFYDATNNPSKQSPYNIVYYDIPVADIFAKTLIGLNDNTNNVFSLTQNYPNPSNGMTTIPVKLTRNADVKISVVNVVGQTVYSNVFENNAAGLNNFEINVNATPGIYFYSVEAGDFKETRRMIIE